MSELVDVRDSSFINKILQYEKENLDSERFEHCQRVAETSKVLCRKFGLNEKKGYSCGLAHDMCKRLSDAQFLTLAACDGYEISESEKEKPSLLHGRAAAVLLRNSFGVQDQEYLDAIAWHTYGKKDLTDLGLVVFAADKIEPGRENMTKELYEEMLNLSLKDLCIRIVKENMEYLKEKKCRVSKETLEFLTVLEGRKD